MPPVESPEKLVPSPLPSVNTKRRRVIRYSILGLLLLYLSTYSVISWLGDYEYAQSGMVRFNFGLSVTDIAQWQPRYAHCRLFRQVDGTTRLQANFWGTVFAPLILMDQWLVHPSKRIFDENGKFLLDKPQN